MYFKPRRKFASCANCDMVLRKEDNFCPHCGQENHHLNVPFHHLMGEFLETIFHIDTKFWATLKAIFIPGKLTNEFVAGKRVSYMPPARFYIMASFFFFLAINYSLKMDLSKEDIQLDTEDKLILKGHEIKYSSQNLKIGSINSAFVDNLLVKNGVEVNQANRDTTRQYLEEILSNSLTIEDEKDSTISFTYQQLVELKNTTHFDSLMNIYLKGRKVNELEKSLLKKIIVQKKGSNLNLMLYKSKMDTLSFIDDEVLKSFKYISDNETLDSVISSYKIEPSFMTRIFFRKYYEYKNFDFKRDINLILNLFTKYLSYVMFILMPVVALILLIVNYRWKKYYYEYLIFSIHSHTILFLFGTIEIIVRFLLKCETVLPIFSIVGMFPYLLISLKNVYKQSWTKTSIKFILISTIYSIIFSVFIFMILVYSLISF